MPTRSTLIDETAAYERWLATFTTVHADALAIKRERMTESPFALLRATYYRWLALWRDHGSAPRDALVVRSIGDAHIENFGTWRDHEGRLIWGVNDFDEASPLPWTQDLVRLATSAVLAIEHGDVHSSPKEACEAIWEGYRESLDARGRPFVLAEGNRRLRAMATDRLKDPVLFWERLNAQPVPTGKVPSSARRALHRALPSDASAPTIRTRASGLGSLGRPRYVALSEWGGAHIAREVKALAPPASCFVSGTEPRSWLVGTTRRAIRVADPFFAVHGRWIVRRLAPDCSRIELSLLPTERDETKLLHSMGWEVANVHLGRAARRVLRAECAAAPNKWLITAAQAMRGAVERDFADWTAHYAVTR
jgi:hypothetical protein